MLVAAHFGHGHTARCVLERLPEALLAGAQRLLLALQADQGALHIGPQPGVADRDGGLEGVHLEGFLAPGAGPPAVARPVDGDHSEQLAAAVRRGVHGREEAVHGVPLVGEAGRGSGRVPLRYVVVIEHPALGVRDEAQVAPALAHGQPAVPGGAGADPSGHQRLGARAAGDRGDHEIAVGADEIDRGQLIAEPGDRAVGDRLKGVREAACGVQLGDHLVQLPQGRKTDVWLRLGLHRSLSLRPRQQTPRFFVVRFHAH